MDLVRVVVRQQTRSARSQAIRTASPPACCPPGPLSPRRAERKSYRTGQFKEQWRKRDPQKGKRSVPSGAPPPVKKYSPVESPIASPHLFRSPERSRKRCVSRNAALTAGILPETGPSTKGLWAKGPVDCFVICLPTRTGGAAARKEKSLRDQEPSLIPAVAVMGSAPRSVPFSSRMMNAAPPSTSAKPPTCSRRSGSTSRLESTIGTAVALAGPPA